MKKINRETQKTIVTRIYQYKLINITTIKVVKNIRSKVLIFILILV